MVIVFTSALGVDAGVVAGVTVGVLVREVEVTTVLRSCTHVSAGVCRARLSVPLIKELG